MHVLSRGFQELKSRSRFQFLIFKSLRELFKNLKFWDFDNMIDFLTIRMKSNDFRVVTARPHF